MLAKNTALQSGHAISMQLFGQLKACDPHIIRQLCVAATFHQYLHAFSMATSTRNMKSRVSTGIPLVHLFVPLCCVLAQLLQSGGISKRRSEVQGRWRAAVRRLAALALVPVS